MSVQKRTVMDKPKRGRPAAYLSPAALARARELRQLWRGKWGASGPGSLRSIARTLYDERLTPRELDPAVLRRKLE